MRSRLVFLFFLFALAVYGWGACVSGSYMLDGGSVSVPRECITVNPWEYKLKSFCGHTVATPLSSGGSYYFDCSVARVHYCGGGDEYNCISNSGSNLGVNSNVMCGGNICGSLPITVLCTQKCDSPSSDPDTTWHCQNSGGPESGGIGGAPSVALLFRCVDGVCTQTSRIAGSCQDWGFCPDGVSDCDVNCEGSSCPPCARSGSGLTSSTKCYYACADGKQLACTPTSTQYVAGAIYAGTCPPNPPASCRPSSSSSGASSSPSSGGSSSPSSGGSSSPFVPPPTSASSSPSGGDDWEYDYSPVLAAIHDTLHHANTQRDFLLELQNAANFSLNNIDNYTTYNYNELNSVNSKLSTSNTLLSEGFSLVSETGQDISAARDLLDEINRYLHSDSMLSPRPSDTTYNPLLRDIKDALDSASFRPSVDTSIFVRDSVFAKWWANYYSDSASSRGLVGKALNAVTQNLSVADSTKKSDCGGFYGCMRVYKNMGYCSNAWGVGSSDCVESGTPFDGMWNVEAGILETVWDGIFGDDTTTLSTLPVDTDYVAPPAADSAKRSLLETISALFSRDSTAAILNKVQAMKDSAEKRANDTTKIQPDSLYLDSSEAAHYVSNFLLPSGTGTDCFVCSANLGTFGGLAKQDLQIVIDFSNFGGFNWCALIRAVVKIATLVVCISLTLGSWAAAFGYNPKNDA